MSFFHDDDAHKDLVREFVARAQDMAELDGDLRETALALVVAAAYCAAGQLIDREERTSQAVEQEDIDEFREIFHERLFDGWRNLGADIRHLPPPAPTFPRD